MDNLVSRLSNKIQTQGFVSDAPLIITIDGNKDLSDEFSLSLHKMLMLSSLHCIIFAPPAALYYSIISQLSYGTEVIRPQDSETRLFLGEIPVIESIDTASLSKVLTSKSAVIIRGQGILVVGKNNLQEAMVAYGAVCFACFVYYFVTGLGSHNPAIKNMLREIQPLPANGMVMQPGPFEGDQEIMSAIAAVGRQTVTLGLVDSFFGNVSWNNGKDLWITETHSFLDELEGRIVSGPLSIGVAIPRASSETEAHRLIAQRTGCSAVLHGHPRFTVIMSMLCDHMDCADRGNCYRYCPRQRSVRGIPIVSGEVGCGEYGLSKTVPEAIAGKKGVIVYGHGVFTTGRNDFNEALSSMLEIERMCREEYVSRYRPGIDDPVQQ